jgi:hypothetical protein
MLAAIRTSVACFRRVARPLWSFYRDFQTGRRSIRGEPNPVERQYEILTFENTRCYTQANASKSVPREVPTLIRAPEYATNDGIVPPSPLHIIIKTSKDLEIMRRAGEMARHMLQFAGSLIRVRYDGGDRKMTFFIVAKASFMTILY